MSRGRQRGKLGLIADPGASTPVRSAATEGQETMATAERQRLCLALSLWNGRDPILKERMFGLTNAEGNHGEDVKECYFYLDATPTSSYLKMLYKCPQAEFPYADLIAVNGARGKTDPEYELLDAGPKLRNREWRHLVAWDIISMPDKWEYPWFAAWDLAFHAIALAVADMAFAKQQLRLLLDRRYLHPNGQLSAYEWNFSDVNPPVHAWATLFVCQLEKALTGQADRVFLETSFQELMKNFGWWLNRKDADDRNIGASHQTGWTGTVALLPLLFRGDTIERMAQWRGSRPPAKRKPAATGRRAKTTAAAP
jgi:hypothetical protein